MTKFTLANVRILIEEYTASHPGGVDVSAHVLSRLGRESVEAHARAAKLTLEQAIKEVEATVHELLLRKHPGAQKLELLPAKPEHWPDLAGWVTGYTAYRIG